MSGDVAAPRRNEALAFIIEHIFRSGTSPSAGDIARAMGFSRQRAQQLVNELIARRVLERTGPRSLRIRDLVHCRQIIVETWRSFGGPAALPLGELLPPLSISQLPVLPLIMKDTRAN